MEAESERVDKILRDDFDAALLERDAASEAFDKVIHEILPHPDGAQRIKNASDALSAARDKMIAAMIRLRDFQNRGIIPEDLQKKPAQKESGFIRPKAMPGSN